MHALAKRRLLSLALALTAGCATFGQRPDSTRVETLRRAAQAEGLVVPHPLTLDDDARELLLRQVGRTGTELERLQRLNLWLRGTHGLGFRYQTATRTAQEAFATAQGDCLSYAHLFVAAARLLGVPANYSRIRQAQDTEDRDDGQLVVVSHVAALYNDYRVTVLVELSGRTSGLVSDYQGIGDDEAFALHLSNLAMEQLARGEAAAAERVLRLLVTDAPALPELRSNLGAVLLRRGKHAEALAVLRAALERFPDFLPLFVNASQAARELGDTAQADALAERARTSASDPFLLLVRGAFLLDRGRPGPALPLLEKAARARPERALFQAWLAKAQLATGDLARARQSLALAQAADPRHPLVVALGKRLAAAEN